ncbi:FAD-dependent oxidoreductase [Pigmentiphaga aceris]|uniref:FAD-dependent oxidoreductase n=1 Tax=Pigmentiphaga aceris TaxID=1940612 RepID=UPI001652AE09|nr:NAD(P)/FAD-dependent oxidoreductase [Pigmentiphaga aceris]
MSVVTPAALAALEARAQAELLYRDFPHQQWVRPQTVDGARVRDVVIVGAGLSGLGIAFGLLREQISNIEVIDRAPAGVEGPWLTYARMLTLRTAKTLVGPDLGVASLSFPAWYTAVYGDAAWESLTLASNTDFMAYLVWFRRVAGIPVSNGVELLGVQPAGNLLALDILQDGVRQTWHTRKLVLATGLPSAGPLLPGFTKNLPRHTWAHSADDIDFHALRGKRVAVLGAGASAFDNAAVALEHGAASVHLFARRARIEQPAIKTPLEFAGLYRYFRDLGDDQRWRIMRRLARHSTPPPPYSIERCTRHQNFGMTTSCTWNQVQHEGHGDVVRIDTSHGVHEVDFIILGTGFSVDVARRPELAGVAHDIALWRDCYTPPADDRPDLVNSLAQAPYLGPHFEYCAKPGHVAPWLDHIHDFGIASLLSMGRVSLGVPGMKFGPPRLVEGISRSLFLQDADWHEANLAAAEALALADTPETGSVI